ncbi:MAG: DUF2783 domain-containing protein [Roseomonas sp.]|nr:DUF2783 domain-containing protein [Roseomonas sp.]MCA3314629.1 DUF2783 domain-containing protein [Roseomonas sp.]MCA3321431.1 DUF2783 domain-containing protein [Roseomonas sp.]MCA3342288.1 DUF2783 domain-containing protein [Roseomonas sp.]
MTRLDTSPRFADADAAYRAIIDAHRGLTESESADLNAALVLVLANQLGDLAILQEALALAYATLARQQEARPHANSD